MWIAIINLLISTEKTITLIHIHVLIVGTLKAWKVGLIIINIIKRGEIKKNDA